MAKKFTDTNFKIVSKILLFIITFLVLYAWLKVVDTQTIIANFKHLRMLPALGFAFLSLFTHLIYSFSLKLLINPVKKVSTIKIFQIYLVGAFLNSVAGTGYLGLAVEIFLFYKLLGVPVSASISAFGIMRLIDLGVNFSPLIFIPFVGFKIHNIIRLGISFSAFIFIFLIVFVFLLLHTEKKGLQILQKLLFFLPPSFTNKLLNFISTTFENIRAIGKSKINILLAVLVLLSLLPINVIGFGFAFFSFPFEIKDIISNRGILELILSIIIGNSMLYFLFALPALPGQIGTMQWYIRFVFVYGIGFPASIVDTITVLIHPLYFFTTMLAGGISVILLGVRISLLKEEILNFTQSQSKPQ